MSDSDKPVLITMVSVLTPLVIGALGIYFTNVYKTQETVANRINWTDPSRARSNACCSTASVAKQY
jgi:hypothetical protein